MRQIRLDEKEREIGEVRFELIINSLLSVDDWN
jgi:hypothetical protein